MTEDESREMFEQAATASAEAFLARQRPAGALDGLLGRRGEPVSCKVFADDLAVHWYPTGAVPGDTCLCGKATMRGDEEEGV